jgi:hypothetical protein
MMARSTNAPCKGRIQMRKTNPLHLFTFGLQRTAGPYSWVRTDKTHCEYTASVTSPLSVLVDPSNPAVASAATNQMLVAARTLGLELHVLDASTVLRMRARERCD